MKCSSIGGQAVIEGIMMRNGNRYAVAVRKPNGEIAGDIKECKSITDGHKWMQLPFIRGAFKFVDSLIIGTGSLMYSSDFYIEDEVSAPRTEKQKAATTAFTLVFAVLICVGIFMLLPVFLSNLFKKVTDSAVLIALFEGVIRIVIFVGYVSLIAPMPDIKRTFMYHGAEHKCINCIEHMLPLTVDNVRASSKEHKRCGTSFMLIVMLISVILFMFIRIDNLGFRLLSRILLVPVIAGLSFELLQFTGRYDNKFVNVISRPGMWLQGLTTKEPDDSMIEVAIVAVEKVFDWRAFQGLPPKEETEEQNEALTEDVSATEEGK